MALIRFGGFRGELPRIHPRLLPEGGSQEALNVRMDSGAVESIRSLEILFTTRLIDVISLYRYTATIWLEAETDTDWTPYPVADDQFGRVIFTDPSADEPRVADASQITGSGYPASYYRLDVPAPEQGFSATLQGTADDAEEVPETRYYVCTFVNSWGAEGPPSPPTNEIEWRTGQTVLLESLPAVPSGSYNITHRRIYRINTGSTGTTNYQYVTEVSVTAAPKSIQSITQANPVVVTTTTAHGLSDGQEVVFSGLGLEATQAIVDPGINRAFPPRVNVPSHGYATGQVVAFDGLGGGNGMDELDDTRHAITYVDAGKFDLTGLDATSYTPWVAGGTVARAHGMDELNGNSYVVEVIDSTSFSLVGIDGTGYFPYVDEGTVQQVAGTSYTDGIATASLGEVLPTELYDPPNAALKGIKVHPSGFLVGFHGQTLSFSEPGAPHAWPIDYRQVVANDIVGLGVFGNTVAVLTKGWPVLAVGSDPAAMSVIELEVEQSCTAKRSIVDFGTAIGYASPDGLIVISGSGATNASASIFTRDQWQALNPSSFVAFNWEQKYLCFYDATSTGGDRRGFIIDPFDPGAGVRYVSRYIRAGYRDLEEDLLYLIDRTGVTTAEEVSDNFNRADIGSNWDGWPFIGVRELSGLDPADFKIGWNEELQINGSTTAGASPTFAYNVGYFYSWYVGQTFDEDQFVEVDINMPFLDNGDRQALAVMCRGNGVRIPNDPTVNSDGEATCYYGQVQNLPDGIFSFTLIKVNWSYWWPDDPAVDPVTGREIVEVVGAESFEQYRLDTSGQSLVGKFRLEAHEDIIRLYFDPDDAYSYGTIPSPIYEGTDSEYKGRYVGLGTWIQNDAGDIYDNLATMDNFRAGAIGHIGKWDQGTNLEYTWKSAPVHLPNAGNMAAAKIIADDYPVTAEFYVDNVKRHTRVVTSSKAFRLPSGFQGEKFEVILKSKKRVSEVAMASSMRELSTSV